MGLVVVLALLLRLLYLWGQIRNNPVFEHPMLDALQHHEWAQAIAAGKGLGDAPYYRAPLYYYLLAGLYALVGPSALAGRLMGIVIGTLNCVLIGGLASSLAGRRAGVFAAFLAAMYWPFIYFDAELLTVGLEICLNTLTLLLLIRAGRQKTFGWFLLAGAALGLAAVTRPNILAFIPFVALWCLIIAPTPVRWRFTVGRTAAVCIAAGLMILPVTIRNYLASGELVLVASSAGVNFYIGNNAEADGVSAQLPGVEGRWTGDPQEPKKLAEREVGRALRDTEVSRHYFEKGLHWIKENPRASAVLLLKKLRSFWIPYELANNQSIVFFANMSPVSAVFWLGFPVVVTLAGGGLFAVRRRWRMWFHLFVFGLVHMLTVIIFFCPARYRLPIAPVLIVLAGAGLAFAARSISRRHTAQIKSYLMVCGGCALMMLGSSLGGSKIRKNDFAGGHYRLGLFYAEQAAASEAELEPAIVELRAAVELGHPGPSARLALARALFESNKKAEAEFEYRRAAREFPDDLAAQRRLGEFLAVQGRDAEAARQFMAALKINPLSAETHQELGCLLLRQGDPQSAVEHLREALRLDPTLSRARLFLSQSYARQGDLAAAIGVFDEILDAQPDNPGALSAVGNLQIRAGELEQAIATFDRARKARPDLPDLSFGYATALRLTGRRAEAVKVLRAQLEATPNDPQCLALLAWILATAKEDDIRDGRQAAKLANRAITLESQPSPEALDAQAAAYAEMGRFADAERVARAAAEAARKARRPALVHRINARVQLYAGGKPYQE